MADTTKIPEFGNWENEEIPYTICFDNATKGKKSGQLSHPNDPQENHEIESKGHKSSKPPLPNHERGSSREEIELRRLNASPLHPKARKTTSSGENTPRRNSRQNRSIEQSPVHPISTSKLGGKSGGFTFSSPSWERKGAFEPSPGRGPSTPGRTRWRSVTRGDETPDRSPAIPKFGEWDETDPTSAEEYSQIFSRIKEEKNNETGKVPVAPNETSYSNGQKYYRNDNSKGCGCFSWGKKY